MSTRELINYFLFLLGFSCGIPQVSYGQNMFNQYSTSTHQIKRYYQEKEKTQFLNDVIKTNYTFDYELIDEINATAFPYYEKAWYFSIGPQFEYNKFSFIPRISLARNNRRALYLDEIGPGYKKSLYFVNYFDELGLDLNAEYLLIKVWNLKVDYTVGGLAIYKSSKDASIGSNYGAFRGPIFINTRNEIDLGLDMGLKLSLDLARFNISYGKQIGRGASFLKTGSIYRFGYYSHEISLRFRFGVLK